MKKIITVIFLHFIFIFTCIGQYGSSKGFFSTGINFSNYLGKGEGDNYFTYSKPGFQLELAMNIEGLEDHNFGISWIFYGLSYNKRYNYVGKSKIPVKFWTPYYTEVSIHQRSKNNPLFAFIGYDYVRMSFSNMKKPDNQQNITLGCGWNLKLSHSVFIQFKLKPYFILGNSIGQRFGVNYLANIHIGVNDY